MSEEEHVNAAPVGDPTPGELLQRQRERSGLTLERAAQDLHLDTWVIEAIETNRFSALGAPVFAKGHLRKYAAMLGVPVEEVLRRYERIAEGVDSPSLIPAAHGSMPRRSISFSPWYLVVIAVLVVGGIVAWWVLAPNFGRDPAGPQAPASETATPLAAPQTPAASGDQIILRPAAPPSLPEVLESERSDEAGSGAADGADAAALPAADSENVEPER